VFKNIQLEIESINLQMSAIRSMNRAGDKERKRRNLRQSNEREIYIVVAKADRYLRP
jgi:hypothetical protein